jgi:hypothetical protein
MKKIPSILKQKKTLITVGVIVIVLIVLGLIISLTASKDSTKASSVKPGKTISAEEAKAKAEDFVNKYLMQSGSKATIKDITTEYGLYKLSIDITSDVVESYITKDGKLFFPQALNIAEISAAKNTAATGDSAASTPSATVTKKSDKPVVELFVMSYCPYGTQMEKGILPAVKALGNKIDFELKFCNYSMHGDKELAENLTQYCINTEQNDKLDAYLTCFLNSSDSASCLDSTGVNKNKVSACVAKTDAKYKVTENAKNKVGYQGSYPSFDIYKADNAKYNVGGSPTLIINGEDIQSNRDSASLLATICSAFNNQPDECKTALSSTAPSAGFGSGTTSGSTSGSGCN